MQKWSIALGVLVLATAALAGQRVRLDIPVVKQSEGGDLVEIVDYRERKPPACNERDDEGNVSRVCVDVKWVYLKSGCIGNTAECCAKDSGGECLGGAVRILEYCGDDPNCIPAGVRYFNAVQNCDFQKTAPGSTKEEWLASQLQARGIIGSGSVEGEKELPTVTPVPPTATATPTPRVRAAPR